MDAHENFPLLLNFDEEYALRKVQETRMRLDMNGTHQLLTYAMMSIYNILADPANSVPPNNL